MSRFLNTLAQRPLVLDSALGTRLIARGLDLSRDDPSLWSLDHPDSVLALHHQDRQSGADVLLTNTFGANQANLTRLNRPKDQKSLLSAAVSLARSAAAPHAFVAACLGPVPGEDILDYQTQADLLIDQGVDLLILETQSAEPALTILDSLEIPSAIPVIVSLFRLPDPPFDPLHRLADLGLAALGVNCVPGPFASIEALTHFPTGIPLLAKPSATPLDPPESFASAVPQWLSLGVRLIGGCCGATHAHVASIRSALDERGSQVFPLADSHNFP